MRKTALACANCLLIVENGYVQLTQGGPEVKCLLQEGLDTEDGHKLGQMSERSLSV